MYTFVLLSLSVPVCVCVRATFYHESILPGKTTDAINLNKAHII